MRYKTFDKTLTTDFSPPAFESKKAAGFDLRVRTDTEVLPGVVTLVPLNVAIQIPEGYYGDLRLRSSTPKKFNIIQANGAGVIDADYCGDNDEIMIPVIPLIDTPVYLRRGDRIAQLIITPYIQVELEEVDVLGEPDRNGFGSTGE